MTIKAKRLKRSRRTPPDIEDVKEPFCGSRLKTLVPLCDADPNVAEEWYYKKNCGWGPEDFSHGSGVKAWWQCRFCLRVYKAAISNRVLQASGCPYCASKRVCTDNALTVLFPEVAKEWHPKKNGKLKLTDVMHASIKRAWWLCSKCSHEWDTTIADRTFNGAGCPACYRARVEYKKMHHVKAVTKPIVLGQTHVPSSWFERQNRSSATLAEDNPDLAKQWHPTKNGKWKPADFLRASGVKVWWKCANGGDHEWQATICHRNTKGRGCPFCAGKKASITNSLERLNPKIAKEWHQKLNGSLTPADVTSKSEKKVWWQCRKVGDHAWHSSPAIRAMGSGCPKCYQGARAKK